MEKVSRVIFVDFNRKKVIYEDIKSYNKRELIDLGLLNFKRLTGNKGEVHLVVQIAS